MASKSWSTNIISRRGLNCWGGTVGVITRITPRTDQPRLASPPVFLYRPVFSIYAFRSVPRTAGQVRSKSAFC
jgi:hypothetical protein